MGIDELVCREVDWMEGWDGDASLRWHYGWHEGLGTVEEMGYGERMALRWNERSEERLLHG